MTSFLIENLKFLAKLNEPPPVVKLLTYGRAIQSEKNLPSIYNNVQSSVGLSFFYAHGLTC